VVRLQATSGSPAERLTRCFPPASRPCPSTVHPAFEGRVHPPSNVLPLQSAAACCLPAFQTPPTILRQSKTLRNERLPWGSAPSSRRQPAASTHARDPNPALRSVPGVSHALDGFRHHRPCGFVSPRCHVQDFPSGVCPSPRSRTGFRRPDALVPLDRFACGVTRAGKPIVDFRALLPAPSAVASKVV